MWHAPASSVEIIAIPDRDHELFPERIIQKISSRLVDIAMALGAAFLVFAAGLGLSQIIVWILIMFHVIG